MWWRKQGNRRVEAGWELQIHGRGMHLCSQLAARLCAPRANRSACTGQQHTAGSNAVLTFLGVRAATMPAPASGMRTLVCCKPARMVRFPEANDCCWRNHSSATSHGPRASPPAINSTSPRGAGMRRTLTEPQWPVTLVGTVCTCSSGEQCSESELGRFQSECLPVLRLRRGISFKLHVACTGWMHAGTSGALCCAPELHRAAEGMQPTLPAAAAQPSLGECRCKQYESTAHPANKNKPAAHLADLVAPVAAAHRHQAQLGHDDGACGSFEGSQLTGP